MCEMRKHPSVPALACSASETAPSRRGKNPTARHVIYQHKYERVAGILNSRSREETRPAGTPTPTPPLPLPLLHQPLDVAGGDGPGPPLPNRLPLQPAHGGVVAVLDRIVGPSRSTRAGREHGRRPGKAEIRAGSPHGVRLSVGAGVKNACGSRYSTRSRRSPHQNVPHHETPQKNRASLCT